ncbi:MAG TPA: two-component regulator propeller domain-containing protein [Bacteroidia bacterium]|jgi:ligand-binding sensor domain-containing protein/two-component sensor histidine kinase|nr:two-component regulator propeller domain-containing protein [Bacteroidia bacterium]
MRNSYKLLFLVFLCLAGRLFPQTYNFENISLEHGLPQAQINCLKEDTRGYLWVGTQGGGVAQYDGINFKIFDETSGLPGSIVTAIEEDKLGHMWFGTTWGGVSRYDGKSFSNFTSEDGLLASGVKALCCDKYNKMYVATSAGLNLIEDKIVSPLKQDIFNGKNTIKSILRDNQQNLWFLTEKELHLYNYYEWINIGRLFKIKSKINTIAQDKSGNIWFATEKDGLFILTKKPDGSYEIIPYERNKELEGMMIQNLVFDNRNILWICTQGFGVGRFDGSKLSFFNRKSGFKSSAVTTVCEDRSGNIWFGTDGNGIIKYNPAPFIYYDNIDGFDTTSIFGIICDKEDNLWAAPYGIGLIKYDGIKEILIDEKAGLSNKFIRAIGMDCTGVIWLCSNDGLFSVQNGKAQKAGFLPAKTAARSILVDNDNSLWIGTGGQFLYHYKDKKLIHYTDSAGLSHNYIHTLWKDKKGCLWIGTGNGVNCLREGKIVNFKYASGFCNDYIGSITEDKYGNIWFGTDRCLVRYNGHEYKAFTQSDGLASSTIYSLITDAKGNLWVGTNRGVDRVEPSMSGEIMNIKNYSYYEGFKGIECNSRAVTKDSKGNLYFATIKGIIEYTPDKDLNIENKPQLHITGMKLFSQAFDFEKNGYATNGGWFHLPTELTLAYNKNYVSFKFVGINLYSPKKIKYEYMLEGFDKEWIKSEETEATYTNLQPGNYIFKVKAYSSTATVFSQIEYPFIIKLPFWKSIWFYLFIFGLLAVGIYLLLKYRTKKMELENQKLEDQVKLRTGEILKQKNEIEVLFKEVHHRVKNNLQVINSLLNLQKFYIHDQRMLDIFKDCQNRIYAMAVIHERLYETNELSALNFNEYIKKLIKQLGDTYQTKIPVTYETEVNVDKLDLDTLIPVGLLINEIISNSLKYAFDEEPGKNNVITFKMYKDGSSHFRMIIGDNGKGSKIDIDETHITFGLELIKMLVDQLHGSIARLPQQGTVYQIIFSALK